LPPAASTREAAPRLGPPPPFRAAWWLPGPHAQTLWASLCRRAPRPHFSRQRLELPDGDFLDLDWGPGAPPGVPLVLLLHGLEGSARSPYVRALVHRLHRARFQALVMHFRGCGGQVNRLQHTYHSGDTVDLDRIVRWLRAHWPRRSIGVVGFSLGGNVLLKWLGEQGEDAPVDAAAAVCVPLRLEICADRMERGLSRLYLWRLTRALKAKVRAKYRRRPGPLDLGAVARTRGFRDFDEIVTARLHGFTGADDYYRRASSIAVLRGIRRRTLLLQARDDPFMTPDVLPRRDEMADAVLLETPEHGGHVGFVGGCGPLGLTPRYWLDERLLAFLAGELRPASAT
jgi:predicted alpha/beta-fold hydrolase